MAGSKAFNILVGLSVVLFMVAIAAAQEEDLIGAFGADELGGCPTFPDRECPPLDKVNNQCLLDVDCTEGKKCCSDGCELICATPNKTESTKEVCAVPVDLGFLIDASGSIGVVNFQKILQFVAKIVDAFEISEQGTHVGVIYYSDDAIVHFDFNKFRGDELTKDTVINELNKISVTEGQTRIDLALKLAKEKLFSVDTGMRPDKPKIALVMTDGRQTKGEDAPDAVDLHIASRPLKEMGVQVYSLGIGKNYDIGELLDIASDDASVFRSADVDELVSIVASITEQTCKGCTNPVDIHFAIDSSAYVGEENFEMIRNFLKAVGYKFIISETGSHMSASVFGDDATLMFNMSRATSQDDFLFETNKLVYLGDGSASMDKALRLANDQVFTLEGFARQKAPKVLVVITGSNCDSCKEPLEEAVKPLKAAGTHIITIPVGPRTSDKEMQTIASHPFSKYIIPQNSFLELLNGVFIQQVSEMICSGKPGVCKEPPLEDCVNIVNNCDVDVDCPSGRKCCLKNCKQICEPPVTACIVPIDLAIGIETVAGSEESFEAFKTFSNDLLNHFKIKPSGTHVSITTFGDKPTKITSFSDTYDPQDVKSTITSLEGQNGAESNIGDFFKFVNDDVISLRNGVRNSQPRVVLVFTNGDYSEEQLSAAQNTATELKNRNNQIIIVNVGDKSKTKELEKLVSKPSGSTLVNLEDLKGLQNDEIKDQIAEEVCSRKNPKTECLPKTQAVCSVRDNLCERDIDCPGREECAFDGCRRRCAYCGQKCPDKLDLLLMLEDSAKVGVDGFQKTKNLVKTMLEWFNINQNGTNVAVMTYSNSAKLQMPLPLPGSASPRQTLFDIQGEIDAIPYTGGEQARLDLALGTAAAQVFPKSGPKRKAKKAIVIFTDGNVDSEKRLDVAVWPLKSQKIQVSEDKTVDEIRIMAASIGNKINLKRLETVVTPPIDDNIFVGADFDDMYNGMRALAEESCDYAVVETRPPIVYVPGDPGPPGDKGAKGGEGMEGMDGDKGATGPKGDRGDNGPKGMRGEVGPPGGSGGDGNGNTKGPDPLAGAVGAIEGEARPGPGNIIYDLRSGPDGPPGPVGKVGPAGPAGDIGPTGKVGRDGPAGLRGLFGNAGTKGEPGLDGNPGEPGEAGQAGDAGKPGPLGSRGIPGPQGPFGYKGEQGGAGGVGDAGDDGLKGAKGYRGEKGDQGDLGPPGLTGPEGPQGPVGPPGQRGLRGQDGIQGGQGDIGPNGSKGQNGPRGNRGPKGQQGVTGARGVKGGVGDVGPQGDQGATGATGAPGPDGNPGEAGADGPPGYPGPVGAIGPMGTRGEAGPAGPIGGPGLTGFKGAAGEPGRRGITGSKGENGEQGEPGIRGPQGQQGKQGKTGSSGPRGPQGAVGSQGLQGQSGDPGQRGRQGAKGNPGMAGRKGKLGDKGSRGYVGNTGAKGLPGEAGNVGQPGIPGRDGKNGQQGINGKDGDPGAIGPQGIQGLSGPAGVPGGSGDPGDNGDQGKAGADGAKGLQGDSGIRGASGVTGQAGQNGLRGERGEAGPPGTTGGQGPPGPRGALGVDGAEGAQGNKGSAGRPGNPGPVGEQGSPGGIGLPGPAGAPGRAGDRGESGPDGGPGEQGASGLPGPRGQTGNAGPDGRPGSPGPSGAKGALGAAGPNGQKGQDGNTGARGPDGVAGPPGIQGARGAPGPSGQPGLDGTPGSAGEPGKNGKPGQPGQPGQQGLRGPAGSPGPRGPKGPVGDRGDAGEIGPVGVAGEIGQTGNRGDSGTRGPIGEIGIPGEIGPQGMPGTQGPPGPAGIEGPNGQPGLPGKDGNKGPIGDPGTAGNPGRPGDQGSAGKDGLPGNAGTAGKQGKPGLEGQRGPQGPSGEQGRRGRPGKVGFPGKNGPKGFAGLNGAPGLNGKKGPRGKEGVRGLAGPAGRDGRDGKNGIDGTNGDPGITGPKGDAGERGDTGAPGSYGEPGATGDAGPTGEDGVEGPRGANGNPGAPGKRGGRGDRGEKGPNGTTGLDGRKGTKGSKGKMGRFGIQGPSGDIGEKGENGVDGPGGHRGPQGNTGEPGPDGPDGGEGPKGPTGNGGQIGNEGISGAPGDPGRPGGAGPPGQPGPAGPPGDMSGALSENFWRYINAGGGQKGPRQYRQRRSLGGDLGQNDIESVFKRNYDLFSNFDDVWNSVHDTVTRKNIGSRDRPAITCADLFRANPYKTSGDYWIDPNEGSSVDAILVHCNATNYETCIYARMPTIEKDDWFNGDDQLMWVYKDFEEEEEGILYSSDSVQFNMMRLMSTRVRQNITYHCKNSNSDDVTFKSDNNKIIKNEKSRSIYTNIIKNECHMKDGKWHESVFELTSEKLQYFPIQDIGVIDIADQGEEFGLEVGPVCFS